LKRKERRKKRFFVAKNDDGRPERGGGAEQGEMGGEKKGQYFQMEARQAKGERKILLFLFWTRKAEEWESALRRNVTPRYR